MFRAEGLRGSVFAVLAMALASVASTSARAGEDTPIATAEGKSSAPSLDATAAPSETASQIKQWLADASVDGGPGPLPDRKIHGEFDAWVGNHGTRGFAAQAVIPVGNQATVAIAVSKSSGYGPYYGGYGDWGASGGFIDPRYVQSCSRTTVRPFTDTPGLNTDQSCADTVPYGSGH